MILAIVGAIPAEVEAVIGAAMDGRSKIQRFSVSHRPLEVRPFALRAALERDRYNADWLTLVPVEHPDEVETVRALGGRVAHVYSMCAHSTIKIESSDLLIACPGKRAGQHMAKPEDIYSLLRTSLLASRFNPKQKRG
ncbi:hypothetical protein [Aeromonas hydrophila]|uniref:hypothetical protein n=1 Tax=Aeromonas hydrophila TaxID=644 RepID=UPI00080825BA|nr:hypothetical protein [Aeromonas hydrophila]OCA65214.1 hypothetical protein A9R12_13855 [Aeromonas hydrophila]